MDTKKPATAPVEKEAAIQFPSAFALFKPSMLALWRNIFTILEALGATFGLGALAVLAAVLGHGDIEALRLPMALLAGVLGVGAIVLLVIFSAGLTVLQIKSSEGHKMSLSEMFTVGKRFAWRVLGINILMTLIFIVSFLLFVVPFFFMLRRYYLAPYFLVDRNLGILEAMKVSAQECKRYSGAVWGLIGVEMLITIIGFIPLAGLVVGTIVDMLYTFAPAVRYVQMKEADAKGVITTGVA